MNLQHYRNFIAVVETGTLSAAALKVRVAQPALSNQIKTFENFYGAKLFERRARRMELTDAGRILYNKAKNLVQIEDAALKEIAGYVDGSVGTLRIGSTQSFPDTFLWDVLVGFHAQMPGIQFEIYEASSGELIELLKDGIVEISVILTEPTMPPPIRAELRFSEHLMAVCVRDNPWLAPGKEGVPIKALKGVPLSISRGLQKMLTEACMREDFTPYYLSVSTSRISTLMWGQKGEAVSIITASEADKYEDKKIFCRPLLGEGLISTRSFAVVNGRTLSQAAQEFLAYCRAKV